jgi:hypothetical protein
MEGKKKGRPLSMTSERLKNVGRDKTQTRSYTQPQKRGKSTGEKVQK